MSAYLLADGRHITGATKVTAFVQTIRTNHPATCPGHPTHQGAHTA